MNPRALFLLGGALVLTGCSSQAVANSPTATTTPSTRSAPTVPSTPAAGTKKSPVSSHPKPHATSSTGSNPVVDSKNPYAAGIAALPASRYDAALADFRAAIARHSHIAASHAGIGSADVGKKDFAAAAKAYGHAAALDPRTPVYLYRAAYASLYSGDFHATVTYASQYVKRVPRDPAGYHLRFLAYGNLFNRKKQIADARVVARLQPRKPSAFNDLGIALANDGKPKQAIKAFDRAIALKPNIGSYYQNRGVAENLIGKRPAALTDLEKARSLTTDKLTKANLDRAIAYLKKQLHRK